MNDIRKFFKEVNSALIRFWKNKIVAAACVFEESVLYVCTGASANPLWKYTEKELQESLKSSSCKKWIMSIPSGVEIGQIEESDYLKAIYSVTSSWAFKRRQRLNLMWVALIHVLMYVGSLFVAAFWIISKENLTDTTMEVMTVMTENLPAMIASYGCFLMLYCIFSIFLSKHFPGFKNHYCIQLQWLLAKHVPSIMDYEADEISFYPKPMVFRDVEV